MSRIDQPDATDGSKQVRAISTERKGRSPFYPGQPVPVELFVGRQEQVDRIMTRGVAQVAAGKPVAVFVQGEYGIGKSSLAGFVQFLAEKKYNLHPLYVPLGTAENPDDLGKEVLETTLKSGAFNPTRADRIRTWLNKYIENVTFFGVSIRLDAIKRDAPHIASGMLPFLAEVFNRLNDTGVKGLFLVLDEINGIAADRRFAYLLKSIVDGNAMSPKPIPLLLMLCGVEERRRQMIQHHPPLDRIFDVIEISALSAEEMKTFFENAFRSVDIEVESEAIELLIEWSAGLPKIMHLVGDAAFWLDRDGVISKGDALAAVMVAAEEVGTKFVDQQVYRALKSRDYHAILRKLGKISLKSNSFMKSELEKDLTDSERKKLNNFLQRMKKLNVLRSGDSMGEYEFNLPMVRAYIWLQSRRDG